FPPPRERPMIELCCPKCRTKLPVAEEKIGKTLFVCPSCAFPLEAPSAPLPPASYSAPLAVPPGPLTPAPLTAPRGAIKEKREQLSAAPRLKSTRSGARCPNRQGRSSAPRSGSGKRVGIAVGVCTLGAAVVAGALLLPRIVSGGKKDSPEGGEETAAVKLDLLEALSLADDLQSEDAEKRKEAALTLAR